MKIPTTMTFVPRTTVRKDRRSKLLARWNVFLSAGGTATALLVALTSSNAGAAAIAGTSPSQFSPSFTSRPGVVGRSHARGRLFVELRTLPSCAVTMPGKDGELADVRLQCSTDVVWLGTVVSRVPGSIAFSTVNFARANEGFASQTHTTALPSHLLVGGLRLNIDY